MFSKPLLHSPVGFYIEHFCFFAAEGDDLTRIFGDVSSSEEEDEDINILDMDEDTRDSVMMGEELLGGEEEEEDGMDQEDEDSKMGMEETEQPSKSKYQQIRFRFSGAFKFISGIFKS